MEPLRDSIIVPLQEESQIPAARRAARDLAERLRLSPDAIARGELVAVELAANILHHAGSGRLFLGSSIAGDEIQLIAMDSGPGIASVDQALRDGFSTSSTPGFGLGAISRLASTSDIFTQFGTGTVLSALIGDLQSNSRSPAPPPSAAVLSTCIHGEHLNGDSWTIFTGEDRTVYTLIDGLGHGLYASEASATARKIAERSFADDPLIALDVLLHRMHGPMRATRGAAIALVSVCKGVAACCGVGNISCALHAPDGSDRSLVSNNGTLGHQMRRVQEFRYPVSPGTLLIMHSDGLSTRWRMSQYQGLPAKLPSTIAGVLFRDAARERDDATVLVARLPRPEGDNHV